MSEVLSEIQEKYWASIMAIIYGNSSSVKRKTNTIDYSIDYLGKRVK